MKKTFTPPRTIICVIFFLIAAQHISAQTEPFTKRTVASGFNSAWEVLYGPNDSLWVTENKAYVISRVNITNGMKTQLVDLRATDPSINFTSSSGTQPQGGLMGLAIHPNLYSSDPAVRAAKPWVYVAYVYNRGSCPGTNTSCVFTTKIVRFDYSGNALINPVTILNTIPGSSDHNSGRLVIGPVVEPGLNGETASHTQYRLYYTVGDMGAGQFLNTTRTENAQNVNVMEGKVLRLNTEVDGDGGQDNWVPNDNPFYNASSITPQDYVFSLGHRNPQGLAWGTVNGINRLYSSEQMDRSDDEVNLIQSGKNYGWDKVSGYCDGNVDGYKIGQNNSAYEWNFCGTTEPPITTLHSTTDSAGMAALMAQSNNAFWPTVACSGLDFYGKNVIPGWPSSLLISPLKKDFIFRIKLNATGDGVVGDTIQYFKGDGNRIRRIRVAPNGMQFYVARDVGASSNGGAIMEYTYTGPVLALGTDSTTHHVVADLMRVYPNPATGLLYVETKKEMRKPLRAQFYDAAGRIVKEITSYQNKFSIDISDLPKGLYTFKLYNTYEVEMQVEKIIKY